MIVSLKEEIEKQGYSLSEMIDLYFLLEDKGKLEEDLQLRDFNNHAALGDFTKKFKDYRLMNYGKGEKSALLLDFQYNFSNEDERNNYITFYFGMNPTVVGAGYKWGDKYETEPERKFRLKKTGAYIQELKFFDFWDYLDTAPDGWENLDNTHLRKEIKAILENADVKMFCSCPSFHWQGMNWRLTQLNGAIYPTNIKPKPKTPETPRGWDNRTEGSFICKHLSILLDYSSIMFFLNQMVSQVRSIIKKEGLR